MSQLVFAVNYGEHPDAGTDSIWSTRAAAEARVAEMAAEGKKTGHGYDYDDARIVEWYLDNVPPDTRPCWSVYFDGSGEVKCHKYEPVRHPLTSRVWVKHDHRLRPFGHGFIYVHAETADLAIKIATERRAATLAQIHPPDVEWAEVKP